MAFKMSPIGKKKCSYSPMQKRGLISDSPVKLSGNTVSSTGEEEEEGQAKLVDRPAEQTGGNVNYMIRDGYQPKGEFVNDKGTRIVKYMNKKGDTQYHKFNNTPTTKGKLHQVIDQETYRNLLSRGEGDRTKKYPFSRAQDVAERDMSGALNQSMTAQVKGEGMAGNYEAAN